MTTRKFAGEFAALCAALLMVSRLLSAAQEPTKDSLETVKQHLADQKAVLVDARTPEERDAGHLQDAVSVPLVRLEKEPSADDLAKVLPKGKICYVYCRSGRRALLAADILVKFGYDFRALKPGYQDLLEAGFPKAE